jgi:hypothetical protein
MAFVWRAVIKKPDLLEAIGFVRTRSGLRVKGIKLQADVDIMSSDERSSFRTANISYDCPAECAWPSPIRANGEVMRRLAPKLEGDEITLTYEDGALILNTTRIPAREL